MLASNSQLAACLLALCSAVSAAAPGMSRATAQALPAGGPVFKDEIGPGKLSFHPQGNWTCGDVVYTPEVIQKTGDWVLGNNFGKNLQDFILSPPNNSSASTLDPRFKKPYTYPWAVSAYNAIGGDSKIFSLADNKRFFGFLSECTIFPSDTQIIFPINVDGSIFMQNNTTPSEIPGPDRIMFDRKGNFCAVVTDRNHDAYHFSSCYAQIERESAITGEDSRQDFW